MIKVDEGKMHVEGSKHTVMAEVSYLLSELAQRDLEMVVACIAVGLEDYKEDLRDLRNRMED